MTTDARPLEVVDGSGGGVSRRLRSLRAHVLLIGASILMLYPLLWMLAASVRPENEIFS